MSQVNIRSKVISKAFRKRFAEIETIQILVSFGILALAFGWAAHVRVFLGFDGVSYLYWIIDHNLPVAPQGRFTALLISFWPYLVRQFVVDTSVLSGVFSASYSLAYVLLIFLCIKMTSSKKSRTLLVWPFLSIGLTGIWGQSCFMSETQLVSILAWPAFLHLLFDKSYSSLIWAPFLFFFHPASFVFFIFFGIITWMSHGDPKRVFRSSSWLILGLVRFALMLANPYEMQKNGKLLEYFTHLPVLPLWGEFLGVCFAITFFLDLRLSKNVVFLLRLLNAFAIIVVVVLWAFDTNSFMNSANFRYTSSSLTIFFMALCWLDFKYQEHKVFDHSRLLWGMVFPSCVWSFVIFLLAFHWNVALTTFLKVLSNSKKHCIEAEAIISRYPLTSALSSPHFTALSLVSQMGLSPRKVVLYPGEFCGSKEFGESISIFPWLPRRARRSSLRLNLSDTGL